MQLRAVTPVMESVEAMIELDQIEHWPRLLDSGDTDITEYHWDNRNRLTEVKSFADYASFSGDAPTKAVDYIYDVENRLIGEKVDCNGDGLIDHQTRFAYDRNQIVLQFDKDGIGDVTGENLSHRYLWGPGRNKGIKKE